MFPVFILLLLCLSICVLAAADLQPSSFSNDVVGSERVWLVEFYSAMCGSCKEFAPTWEKIEFSLKSKLSLGKVNIDDQESMKLAQSLGVLDEGIPCIRIFSSKSSDKGASIMSGKSS